MLVPIEQKGKRVMSDVQGSTGGNETLRGAAWATPVAVHVERDWTELSSVEDGRDAVRASIKALLEQATGAMAQPDGPRQWWSGSRQHQAQMLEHEARALMPLLLEGDELAAHARDLLARAAGVLPRADERVAAVAAQLHGRGDHPLNAVDVAHLAQAIYDVIDRQHVRSRGFRNRIVRLIGAAIIALAGLLAGFASGAIPLDVKGGAPVPAVTVALLGSVFGAIGAFVTGVPPLARVGGTWNPFSLPWYQMLLKVSLGPIFALVGMLMLEASVIPNVEVPMPLPDLLVWALVFGAAQQFVTGVVDDRVRGLVSESATRQVTDSPRGCNGSRAA